MDWRSYWEGKTDAEHSRKDEAFYQRKAAELLLHLDGGHSMLDFGCGAGAILCRVAPHYQRVVGVDLSGSMLAQARTRLADPRVELVQGDESLDLSRLGGPFDRISAASVAQYMSPAQLARLVSNASGALASDGLLVLFDIIDPELYTLRDAHLLGERPASKAAMIRALLKIAISARRGHFHGHSMGRPHGRDVVAALARRNGLGCEFVMSMCSRYRYHALLQRRPMARDSGGGGEG
jgi:cyclopropane-fatty-acyl-phospholipid synthase